MFYCHGIRKLSFTDNEIAHIPPAIASLINLEELDLSKNGKTPGQESSNLTAMYLLEHQLFWNDVLIELTCIYRYCAMVYGLEFIVYDLTQTIPKRHHHAIQMCAIRTTFQTTVDRK